MYHCCSSPVPNLPPVHAAMKNTKGGGGGEPLYFRIRMQGGAWEQGYCCSALHACSEHTKSKLEDQYQSCRYIQIYTLTLIYASTEGVLCGLSPPTPFFERRVFGTLWPRFDKGLFCDSRSNCFLAGFDVRDGACARFGAVWVDVRSVATVFSCRTAWVASGASCRGGFPSTVTSWLGSLLATADVAFSLTAYLATVVVLSCLV